jgi:hypothetical protein
MRAAAAALAVVALAAPVSAQAPSRAPAPGRIEVSIGAGVALGASAHERGANLRANSPAGAPAPLFTASARFAPAPLLEARVGVAVTRRYGLEAHVTATRPELRASLSSDVENAAPLTAAERVEQYVAGGGIVVRLQELHVGSWVPVVEAGGGYLRRLHEGRTLVDEGLVCYVGGGVRHALLARTRGTVRALGVRADARVSLLQGGIAVAGELQRRVSFTGGMFVGF